MCPEEELILPESYRSSTPDAYLKNLVTFFEAHRAIAEGHVVDFITNRQWDLLDPTWQDALLPTDKDDHEWLNAMVNLAAANVTNEDWPESLKEYICLANAISLQRAPHADEAGKVTLDRRILPGMSQKKKHEVERMSNLIADLAKKHKITKVIDLGAGQGYLSRALAFQHNLQVLALDGSEVQTCGAKRFSTRAHACNTDSNVRYATEMIEQDNALSVLSKYNVDKDDDRWLMCGLHACGDLSSLMLQLFTQLPQIVSLVNVGCCYHFLTETGVQGFPMSKALTGYRLGLTAHKLACQAPARWLDKKEETLEAFEHHFYRAVLQLIMVDKGLAEPSVPPTIGKLKKRDFVSFPNYVEVALKRLGIPADVIQPSEAEAYFQKYKTEQVDKKIAIFWTLRTLLAPVIESIVLVDRWMYLNESRDTNPNTSGVWMWPIFDPITSPRNVVIVATK